MRRYCNSPAKPHYIIRVFQNEALLCPNTPQRVTGVLENYETVTPIKIKTEKKPAQVTAPAGFSRFPINSKLIAPLHLGRRRRVIAWMGAL